MLSHEEMQRIEREERRVIEEDHYRDQVRRKVTQEIKEQEEAERERVRQQALEEQRQRENDAYMWRLKRNVLLAMAAFVAFAILASK